MNAQLFTTIATGVLLAMFTAILAWQGKGRFDSLEKRVDLLASEVASMRSDLTHVALAVGARPRSQRR